MFVADRTVVALAADLLFATRIESAITAAGAEARMVDSGPALWDAIERWPELVLVDLSTPGWEEPVRRAKTLPQTRAIPIVAFGSHVDTSTLRAARQAGCDHAWARSRFFEELPRLLKDALHPPTRFVSGWDEPPPPALLHGIEQFNAGEYWECHETLEGLWNSENREVRDLYQGLLQVGVAFHHLQHANFPGAIKLFRRGLPRLRGLPEVCQGVRVAEIAEAARCVHDEALDLGPERLSELAQPFPKVCVERSA
jgi:predicted metal-dependent hydrolase